ncbi:MAG: hypothetical protein ABFD54_03320 [Armatimonadota bacterium]|nr:hypothetical protein [bacterium]
MNDILESRCAYCGAPVVDRDITEKAPLKDTIAIRFCSDACAKAYEKLAREQAEESEEMRRAGAT